MSRPNQADIIWLASRLIMFADEDEQVVLPAALARQLLALAEKAPQPRGRQTVAGRARVREAVVVAWARARKRKLIAGGMKREAAHRQAAEEAAVQLLGRNLAASTVARKMQRRRR